MVKYGTCEEKFWPYHPFQQDKPKRNTDKNAKKYQIKAYARLNGVVEMKRSLIVNGPFLAGVMVFNSWFGKKSQKTGCIPMPKRDEESVGGHAICIVGYNNVTKSFKFKNSWGKKWADHGYGYLPYVYLQKYCSDAWSATDLIENPKHLVKIREALLRRFA